MSLVHTLPARLQLAARLITDALAATDETRALMLLQRARVVIAIADANVLTELTERITTKLREETRA